MTFKCKLFKSILPRILLLGIIHFTWCQKSPISEEISIKKCVCNSNEVQTIEGCLERSPLLIAIWDDVTKNVTHLDITSVNYAQIEPLVCPENYVKENSVDKFFISTTGKLLKSDSFETDLYCLEFVRNNKGDLLLRSESCFPKPSVPSCCEAHEYLDSSEICTPIPNESTINGISMFLDKFNRTKTPIFCADGTKTHELISTSYSMHHFTHIFKVFEENTDGNFCLGMYGDENEIYPGIATCNASAQNQKTLTKIPYCCNSDKAAYHIETRKCVETEEIFQFPSNVVYPPDGAIRIKGNMNCRHISVLDLDSSEKYSLLKNSTLYLNSTRQLPLDKYCIGTIIVGNSTKHSGLSCHKAVEDVECSLRWDIYTICFIISSLFMIATLVVYIGIPELRRRIGGMCLISELLALLVSQINIIVIKDFQASLSESACLAAGTIEIIFILASFFWLNIMCYDVWSTFRKLRPFSEKVFGLKTFLKYSIYGWGIPLLVGVLAVVLQVLGTPLSPGFKPDRACFFNNQNYVLQWFYIYGLISILLVINAGFFLHLAFKLRSSQVDSKRTFRSTNGRTTQQNDENMMNIKLYAKLLVIMGLPWLLEIFTSFAPDEVFCYLWFLDMVNALRGVLIFIIFVCKKTTRDMIYKSWFPKKSSNEYSSQPSRKTSTVSLSQWLPSLPGKKTTKAKSSAPELSMKPLEEENNEAEEIKE